MRVISQNDMVDLPYENICIYEEFGDVKATAIATDTNDIWWTMGEYSSSEKAEKAMEMMREQYAKLSALQTLLQGKAEQCVTKSVNDFIDMFTFHFPADADL